MTKYIDGRMKRSEKLTRSEQAGILGDLVQALAILNDPSEISVFLADLLTVAEAKMLSKRLRIAKFLLAGKTYEEVIGLTSASYGTVAKVAVWLSERGQGFRSVVAKLPKKSDSKDWTNYDDWDKFKRRHILYFWPELVLESMSKKADERERKMLFGLLGRLELKASIHRKLEKLLTRTNKS